MSNPVRRFNRYLDNILPGIAPYDFRNKERNISDLVCYTLNRTSRIFEYGDLPETIPQRSIELYAQTNGYCGFADVRNDLYVFFGGLGGELNPVYMPTLFTVANPALNFSKNLVIDKECVILPNDTMYIGLLPLIKRYATGMIETELSLNIANVNSRIVSLISAQDDRTRESALKYLEDIESGKQGVIADSAFLESIKSQPYGTRGDNSLTNLIELEQYYKASLWNELGLNANYNMKRESLNSAESQLNNDALLPLIDDMRIQREIAIDKVNRLFGTHITVSLSSAWLDNQEEIDLAQEGMGQSEKPAEEETPKDGGEETDEKKDAD